MLASFANGDRTWSFLGGTSAVATLAATILATACQCSADEIGSALPGNGAEQDATPLRPIEIADGAAGSRDGDNRFGGEAAVEPQDASGEVARARHDAGRLTGVLSEGGVDVDVRAPPISLICGDAIRGPDEECDDGNQDDTDFCTKTCRVVDRLAFAADNVPISAFKKRSVSSGHHPIAGNAKSAVLVFADTTSSPNEVRAGVFLPDGSRVGGDEGIGVSEGRPPIEPTDAVVAALPGNSYAIVWTALPAGGNSRSVVMRTLDGATGALGVIVSVSNKPLDNQESVDAVWTGTELVVSWMDRTDPVTPEGRLRRYDASLNPTGSEEDLSTSGAEEDMPTLAPFAGSFAAFWFEETPDFHFDFHMTGGGAAWSVSGIPRLSGSPFGLTALDATHLFAAWTLPEYDDAGLGTARLWGAVLDTSVPGEVTPFRIARMSSALTGDPTRGDDFPVVASDGGRAFVAWSSDPGTAGGNGAMVIKEMQWTASSGLDLSLAEEPLARNPRMQNTVFDGNAVLGFVPWTNGGALFSAWDDDQRTYGIAERTPDIVAQVLPIPIVKLPPADGGLDAQ